MTIETIARKLKTTPQALLKESVFAYLQRRLNTVSIEIDGLKGKWQVKSAEDFEKAIKDGKIHEFSKGQDASEDFFRLSHIEEEKRHLLKLVREYAF
jgi:hypothetical protein